MYKALQDLYIALSRAVKATFPKQCSHKKRKVDIKSYTTVLFDQTVYISHEKVYFLLYRDGTKHALESYRLF